MLNDLQRELPAYEIKTIDESNCERILDVLTSNQAYFRLFGEEAVSTLTCKKMIDALPPHFDARNKLLVGFWKDAQPIALLDVLTAYPTDGSVWIGLLLIHARMHGQAIGRTIHNALAKAAQMRGYSSIQLGVMAENKKALAFWQKLGYRIFRNTPATSPLEQDVYVLAKDIARQAEA